MKSESQNGDNAIPYLRVATTSMIPMDYKGPVSHLCQMVNKQIFQLVDFARRLPHFTSLKREDQVLLLKSGWNELLIATVAWRSIEYIEMDCIVEGPTQERRTVWRQPQLMCIGPNFTLHRNSAQQGGVAPIFDRVLTELSVKMKKLNVDRSELTCLKAIILLNSDLRGLIAKAEVDALREKVYACLEEYCNRNHTDDGRFAQLLLRLPALRSISLKCLDHLFFFRLLGDKQIEAFISDMLDQPF